MDAKQRPLIGVTTYSRNQRNHYTLPAEYVEAVRAAGGVPVLIPPGEPDLDDLLARLDGVILSGGGDLDPAHYGGKAHESIYLIDPERDHFELALARRLVQGRLPTLGVCRGLQVLNVALGGALVEHLPDEPPPRRDTSPVVHRAVSPAGDIFGAQSMHPVEVAPDSRLARILGVTRLEVASWHHQAVRRVAEPLTVTAWAEDGIVEAVELPEHPWFLAVQWHPELTAAEDPVQRRLLRAFVDAARGRGEIED
ncbi:MAG: gamma-glutamyl-gamma-aminobutyrate hydrolase family protein [Caldilineae bacterium]|nr:MAG: gamma-glutamyl-gamma-aminobutyrate hydrolase family protein [Caldilineae bacterium]